jgi:integrase
MRGNITRRGKSSWRIKFDVAAKDGKRCTRYATVRGSYKDAQNQLTTLLNAAITGTLPDPTNMTLAEYFRAWLDSATKQSPKTLERYSELAERQIIPHLGAVKLQKLKPEAVRAWHRTLLDSGLTARTTTHAHKLLRLVLGYAVRSGTLTRNVAAIESPPKVEEREAEILSPEQIVAVLGSLQGHSLYPIAALALSTGMRRGELLGLQWGDTELDAAKPFLRVQRSLEETKAGLRLKPPKTARGRRSITLPADTVALLRTHKTEQMRLRLALGIGNIKPDTLVFGDIEGRPLNPHAVSRAWRRVCDAKNLPRVSFHALRHTHVSVLISAGVDVLTISRRIGHSKASMTLDVYGHLIHGGDEAAAKAIEGVLK